MLIIVTIIYSINKVRRYTHVQTLPYRHVVDTSLLDLWLRGHYATPLALSVLRKPKKPRPLRLSLRNQSLRNQGQLRLWLCCAFFFFDIPSRLRRSFRCSVLTPLKRTPQKLTREVVTHGRCRRIRYVRNSPVTHPLEAAQRLHGWRVCICIRI